MDSRKSSLVLLTVLTLFLISGGLISITAGLQVLGVVLLVLAIASLVWLWRAWKQPSKV